MWLHHAVVPHHAKAQLLPPAEFVEFVSLFRHPSRFTKGSLSHGFVSRMALVNVFSADTDLATEEIDSCPSKALAAPSYGSLS